MYTKDYSCWPVGQDAHQQFQEEQQRRPVFVMPQMSTGQKLLHTAGMAASAYHGYKRNRSVGWAIVWGMFGAVFPVITPVIAVAQGYGKPRGK